MLCRFCVLGLIAWLTSVAALAAEFDAVYGEVYAQRPTGPLKADLYLPRTAGPHPGVLVVHGGAWYTGTRAQLASVAQRLAERGFSAVAISYRLAPDHPFPAQIEDCRTALAWMRANAGRLRLDPGRIGGFGYSAGAQLVALLATDPGPPTDKALPAAGAGPDGLQAVVGGGAPCDFRVLPPDNRMLAFWLGGSRRERPEQYRRSSPAAFVSGACPPMFFFHGETDSLVPVESPQQMVTLLRRAGVRAELYTVPKLGHLFAMMDVQAIEKSIEFLAEELSAATPSASARGNDLTVETIPAADRGS